MQRIFVLFGVFMAGVIILSMTLTSQNIVAFSLSPINEKLPNTGIKCFMLTELISYDANGKKIARDESNFFQDSPFVAFSLADRTLGKDIAKFTIEPVLKCDQELQFQKTPLEVKVFAKTTTKYEIFNAKYDLQATTLHKGDWTPLGVYTIKSTDLEKRWLPDGKYDADLLFTIEGYPKFNFAQYPQYPYALKIKHNDITAISMTGVQKNYNPPPQCSATDSCLPQCQSDETFVNGICERTCSAPNAIVNGVCTPPTSQLPEPDLPLVPPKEIGFFECLSSSDKSCLTDSRYFIYYVAGLFGVVALVGISSRPSVPR